MFEVEQKDPDDLVFPQDMAVKDVDGRFMRYGGLTKVELFAAMFASAGIQRAGLPPNAEAAAAVAAAAVTFAGGFLKGLRGLEAAGDGLNPSIVPPEGSN